MSDLAVAFELHRSHLRRVAYRMLGSAAEADDAVQDAWLKLTTANANAIVGACVERYTRMDKDVRFAPGDLPLIHLRPTAFSRLVTNLIDNALAYGAPPVDVSTRREGNAIAIDIADHGPGIAPEDVARLKQPFTRASAARTDASGVAAPHIPVLPPWGTIAIPDSAHVATTAATCCVLAGRTTASALP